jgi:glycosyltransferase involved in cell wall biosynthesis
MDKTIAVIPVHNEALTIASVVLTAGVYLPVIVVDDASEDDSGQRAATAGAIVLTLPRRCGKGAALQCGFAEALRRGANAVVTLDGDGQHDPRDIPRLLAASQYWPESIIISGRLDGAEAIPRSRFYAMQVASFWINWLGHCQVRDTQSGFRLYPAAVLSTLPLKHGGFIFESEVLIKAGQAGWDVREIPIRAVYVPGRTSHYRPLGDGIPITAYLLYRGLRFWPAQCWWACLGWRMHDKNVRHYLWRCTGVAALATLLLPLLACCVLAYLYAGHAGKALLATAIRRFYDPRLFINPPAVVRGLHDSYRLKRCTLV